METIPQQAGEMRDLSFLPEHERTPFRHRLSICLTHARAYDGTDASYQDLFREVGSFEKWCFATFQQYFHQHGQGRLSNDAEATLLQKYHPTLAVEARSISGILDLAVQRCEKRILDVTNLLDKLVIRQLDGTILPMGEGALKPADGQHQRFSREKILSPRLRQIVAGLQKRRIFLGDLDVCVSDPPKGALTRQMPYLLVTIPRLQNRQVLVCDQRGEAVYVILKHIDDTDAVRTSKASLKERYPDRVRSVNWSNDRDAIEQILHHLFLNIKIDEKIDIASREKLRELLLAKHPPERFIKPDGALVYTRKHPLIAEIVLEGMRFDRIARLFGVQGDLEKRGPAAYALIQAVYKGNSYVEGALEHRQELIALQTSLAQDSHKWKQFIKGTSMEIELADGTKKHKSTEHPLPDQETFRRTPRSVVSKYSYAGRSLEWVVLNCLATPEERALLARASNAEGAAGTWLVAEAHLYDVEKDTLLQRLETLAVEYETTNALGANLDRWRAYVRGEPVEVAGKTYTCPNPFTSINALLDTNQEQREKIRVGGKTIGELASLFSSSNTALRRMKEEGIRLGTSPEAYLILIQEILGTSPDIEGRLRVLRMEHLARKELGKDAVKWRSFIQGKSLLLPLGSETVEYTCERPFPHAEDMAALGSREAARVTFLGYGIRHPIFVEVFQPKRLHPTWNPVGRVDDRTELIKAIYHP